MRVCVREGWSILILTRPLPYIGQIGQTRRWTRRRGEEVVRCATRVQHGDACASQAHRFASCVVCAVAAHSAVAVALLPPSLRGSHETLCNGGPGSSTLFTFAAVPRALYNWPFTVAVRLISDWWCRRRIIPLWSGPCAVPVYVACLYIADELLLRARWCWGAPACALVVRLFQRCESASLPRQAIGALGRAARASCRAWAPIARAPRLNARHASGGSTGHLCPLPTGHSPSPFPFMSHPFSLFRPSIYNGGVVSELRAACTTTAWVGVLRV
eukprot:scaffold5445_cov127-Isochrysis_galbana.AAC.2